VLVCESQDSPGAWASSLEVLMTLTEIIAQCLMCVPQGLSPKKVDSG
jgi:hypothetical protein